MTRFSLNNRTAKRASAVMAAGLLALGVAACGSDDSATDTAKNATSAAGSAATEATSAAGSAAAEASEKASDSMKKEGEASVEADKTEKLAEGDQIAAKASGLDPKLGYYAAICNQAGPAGAPPMCTGEHGDTDAQQWLTNKPGGTAKIAEDGTAEFTLKAVPTGKGVDCKANTCVLKVFGDHTEGFAPVAEVPVTFS